MVDNTTKNQITAHAASNSQSGAQPEAETSETVVLAGNPNVGKSVVFGALTDTYAAVSNYPGTTVDILETPWKGGVLIDSPGVYGVANLSTEEDVTRDVLLKADKVINVIDMTHLERDLFFTLQLVDMGIPLVVFLNMEDEATNQGVIVDLDLLSDLLGVPVLTGTATRKVGIDDLEETLVHARAGHAMLEIKNEVLRMREESPTLRQAELALALEGDNEIAEKIGVAAGTSEQQEEIYRLRRDRVNDIVGHVVTGSLAGANWKAKLSAAMMNPITGVPMLLGFLAVLWVVIGQWVGTDIVGFLEENVMGGLWVPFIQGIVESVGILPGTAVHTIVAGDFGLLTMVPSYLIGVIFPLVTAFYLMLAVLEDSGYLPRIAVLVDKALAKVGLNGRAIIPLILGFGCVTMGALTTRILTTKRERLIATALLAIAVPCSAQIAVITAMMGKAPALYSLIFLVFLVTVFGVVGMLLNKITPGESSGLLIDLPPLRRPEAKNALKKTASKVSGFMKEIFIFFVVGSLIITGLEVTGALEWIINVMRPLVVDWLGLPAQAAQAFVMGFIRRDFGAAGFFTMNLTNAQLLVGMSTITLFVPCIATAMVILKDRGPLYFLGVFGSSLGLAFLLGGLMMRGLALVGL